MATRFTTQRRPSPTLGIVQNLPAWEIDKRAWTVARNVRSFSGHVEKTRGQTPFVSQTPCETRPLITQGGYRSHLGGPDPFTAPVGLGTPITLIDTARFLDGTQQGVVGTNRFLYRFDPSGALIPLNLLPFLGPATSRWAMAQLFGNVYFVNPFNAVQVWPGGVAPVGPLIATDSSISTGPWDASNPGVPRALTATEFKNHLMLGNLVFPAFTDPQGVAGSGEKVITLWNLVDYTQDARSFDLSEGNDPVVRIARLGDFLVIFRWFSIHLAYFSGGTLVYQDQRVPGASGTFSGPSVVPVSDPLTGAEQLYYIGTDGIYMFDGAPHNIGERVWRWFAQQVDANYIDQIIGFFHVLQREVFWGFHSTQGNGLPDLALVYSLEDQAFYIRDWPFTAAGYMPAPSVVDDSWLTQTQSWAETTRIWASIASFVNTQAFVGDQYGQVYAFESKTVDSTAESELVTGLDDFGDANVVKIENGMRVDIPTFWGKPMKVYVRGLMELDQDTTTPFQLVGECSGNSRINYHVSGRWIQRRFVKSDGFFVMASYEPSIRVRGEF